MNSLYGGTGYNQNYKVLYGDYNGDGVVSAADLAAIAAAATRPTYDPFADLNGDGIVDATDVSIVRLRVRTKL